MGKIINTRMALLLCLLLIAGILVVLGLVYGYVVLSAVSVVVLLTLIICLAILSGKVIRSAIMLVFFILGIGTTWMYVYTNNANMICEQYSDITGRIESMTYMDYSVQLVLGDVMYTPLDDYGNVLSEAYQLDGYTTVYVSYTNKHYDFIDLGDYISMRCTMDSTSVLQDSIVTYYYKYNYQYVASSITVYSVTDGYLTLSQKVDSYVLSTLQQYMPNNYGTAYALLLGDKSYMAEGQYETFQWAGIAHLFAISGMHISIIVLVFNKVLSLLNVGKRWRLFIIVPPLLLYGYLCGFSPSISRAIIMSVIILLASRMYNGTDLLSSMSVAMTLILIFRPLYLFDVSFVLSFGAVFGIATLGYALTRQVNKITNNKVLLYILQLMAITLSISVSTVFFVAQYFGIVSVVGLFTNMIVIPLLPFLFVGCVVGLIPGCSLLLALADVAIGYLADMATIVANWQWSTVVLPSIGIAVLVWLVLLFILGGYVNIGGKVKIGVVSVVSVVLVMISLINILPSSTTNSIQILDADGIVVIITEADSGVIHIVNNVDDSDDVSLIISTLSQYNYDSVYIHCTDTSSVDVSLLSMLYEQCNATKLYCYDAYSTSHLEGVGVQILKIDKDGYTNNSVVVGSIYSGGIIGLDITTSYARIAVLNTDYEYALFGIDDDSGYDVVYCASDSTLLNANLNNTILLVAKQQYDSNIYGQNRYGNFTIEPKCGTITINRGMIL